MPFILNFVKVDYKPLLINEEKSIWKNKMKSHLLRTVLFAIIAGAFFTIFCKTIRAEEKPNTLTAMEKKTGWKLLFDGKTTNGWRNYRKKGISKSWVVEGGALVRKNKGAGNIVTVEQYDSFELVLEYKISKGGNSGIMYHVTETENTPWKTGPEVQIQDNKEGHDPQKSGWLYQLYSSSIDATRPAEKWNQVRLRITPQSCEQSMNGVRYTRYVKGSKQWNAKVAKSKFAKYPNFGKPKKGYLCLQDHGDVVAFRNIKIRSFNPQHPIADPVDGVLPIQTKVAFPKMKWKGWSHEPESGKVIPMRPIVLTHANDGTNRIFIATQRGKIYVIDGNQNSTTSKLFLDLSGKVSYQRKKNEEGFLGLSFDKHYKKNGEFVVYYTAKSKEKTSMISKFRVSQNDPDKADVNSEEVLMRISQPYWNHNGGAVEFGPDGYLYIALGDGGAGNDPHGNGQNLSTLLGSILRIDVHPSSSTKKRNGKNYAIPKGNPFINTKGARPEIYAYGLRNPWRFSFDKKTGDLWAADVGQNLFEEIDIIVKGGNYGWSLRESAHHFGAKEAKKQTKLIDPIWEYDHTVGKSITGGYVYRGKRFPELVGAYVYADYVTGKIWALKYDIKKKKVLWNKTIQSPKLPIMSFGEDAQGEIYFMIESARGKGIYQLERK